MRILDVGTSPFHHIGYTNAALGGRGPAPARLPLYRGVVDALPAALDALVVASDLQGRASRVRDGEIEPRLLGELLAEELAVLSKLGESPEARRTGVVLAGDLYAVPTLATRGGLGDVTPVWRAFAASFRWVVGVAGNHDAFGGATNVAALAAEPGVRALDGEVVELDGLSLGGVSGVVGKPPRPWRREEAAFVALIEKVLRRKPTILILHEGPSGPDQRRDPRPGVDAVLDRFPRTLTICGHNHWSRPLLALPRGGQALNVDHRVVLLTR